jgi:hypothetical protein
MVDIRATVSSLGRSLVVALLAAVLAMATSIAALSIASLFGVGATPVLAAAAEHYSFPLAGGALDCGTHQYTFTGGTFDLVVHNGSSPSGNDQNSVEGSADNITASDAAGNAYRVVGIFHFGGSDSANLESGPFHFGMNLQVISLDDGRVDNVGAVLAVNPFGGGKDFVSIGTCTPLG